MKRILFYSDGGKPVDAGYKYSTDIIEIFRRMGTTLIKHGHLISDSFLKKKIEKTRFLLNSIFRIGRRRLVYTIYPIPTKRVIFLKMICSLKKSKLIAVIMDVNSLREIEEDEEADIKRILYYDAIIAQNRNQEKYFRKIGFKGKIVKSGILDFLGDYGDNEPILEERSICYGGALTREQSGFLVEWMKKDITPSLEVNVYGPRLGFDITDKRFHYYGVFHADKVVNQIHGSFGLVWNGDSVESISGERGDYYKFASPHKLSMYLMAGMPVIVHNDSAMAEFVKKNNIGFTVESLDELERIILDMSKSQYEEYKANVKIIRERISKGLYLKNSIKRLERQWK